MENQTPPQGPQGGMPANIPYVINAQFIRDWSFENPNAPGILLQLGSAQPQVNTNISVQWRQLAPDAYESMLLLRLDAKLGDTQAFVVELAYGAVVGVPANIPADVAKVLMSVEIPRMIFPFARQLIADGVREGGFGPLYIAPIDFYGLYRQQVQQEQQLSQVKQAGNA